VCLQWQRSTRLLRAHRDLRACWHNPASWCGRSSNCVRIYRSSVIVVSPALAHPLRNLESGKWGCFASCNCRRRCCSRGCTGRRGLYRGDRRGEEALGPPLHSLITVTLRLDCRSSLTALDCASDRGHVEAVRVLLAAGADVNHKGWVSHNDVRVSPIAAAMGKRVTSLVWAEGLQG